MTSSLLLSLTTFAYLLCTFLYLAGTIFRFKPLLGAGAITGAATLLMQTAGIGLRWVESYRMGYGHAPPDARRLHQQGRSARNRSC